jgi:hypothetical protein
MVNSSLKTYGERKSSFFLEGFQAVLTRLSDKDKMTVKTKFILGIFKNSDTT